jgi:hypothetical protein
LFKLYLLRNPCHIGFALLLFLKKTAYNKTANRANNVPKREATRIIPEDSGALVELAWVVPLGETLEAAVVGLIVGRIVPTPVVGCAVG